MEPLRSGDPGQVGPYRLERRLGAGGMGQVFLGRSRGGRPVAVKVVRPELAEDAGFRRRFALEVEAAGRVGGFYTAQVIDADPDAEPPWLATAYIPGPSLQETMEACGPLPPAAIAALGAGLAEGLAAIHACGLVHRDLKPGNVILADDGPRVIDFGIARALDATTQTLTQGMIGTPSFMSPEQTRGEPVGPPSDVFSLGAVLVFAATGHSPFEAGPAATRAVLDRVAGGVPDLSEVPAGFADLVASCLAKEPGGRPTVGDLLDRFAGAAGTATRWLPPAVATMVSERRTAALTPTRPPSAPASPDRREPRRRPPWQAGAAVLVLAVLLALAAAGFAERGAALAALGEDDRFEGILPLGSDRAGAMGVKAMVALTLGACCIASGYLVPFVVRWALAPIAAALGRTVRTAAGIAAALVGLAAPPLAFVGAARLLYQPASPTVSLGVSLALIAVLVALGAGWATEGIRRNGDPRGRAPSRPPGPGSAVS